MRIDSVDGVIARRGGASHVETLIRTEGQMIRRDAGLQGREHEGLPITADLENCAAAITYVEVLLAIKGDAGRDAHAFRICRHSSIRSNTVHRTVLPRRYINLSFTIDGDSVCVHQFGKKRLDLITRVDPVNRDRHLLPT